MKRCFFLVIINTGFFFAKRSNSSPLLTQSGPLRVSFRVEFVFSTVGYERYYDKLVKRRGLAKDVHCADPALLRWDDYWGNFALYIMFCGNITTMGVLIKQHVKIKLFSSKSEGYSVSYRLYCLHDRQRIMTIRLSYVYVNYDYWSVDLFD